MYFLVDPFRSGTDRPESLSTIVQKSLPESDSY